MLKSLALFWHAVRRTVMLMVGVPDYQCYVQHRHDHHPGEKVMTYEEFFRNRQDARYGSDRIGRCC